MWALGTQDLTTGLIKVMLPEATASSVKSVVLLSPQGGSSKFAIFKALAWRLAPGAWEQDPGNSSGLSLEPQWLESRPASPSPPEGAGCITQGMHNAWIPVWNNF